MRIEMPQPFFAPDGKGAGGSKTQPTLAELSAIERPFSREFALFSGEAYYIINDNLAFRITTKKEQVKKNRIQFIWEEKETVRTVSETGQETEIPAPFKPRHEFDDKTLNYNNARTIFVGEKYLLNIERFFTPEGTEFFITLHSQGKIEEPQRAPGDMAPLELMKRMSAARRKKKKQIKDSEVL